MIKACELLESFDGVEMKPSVYLTTIWCVVLFLEVGGELTMISCQLEVISTSLYAENNDQKFTNCCWLKFKVRLLTPTNR